MDAESRNKGDLFRETIEAHVVELLKQGAANQTISQERAQQIAKIILDSLIPGQPPQEIYQCTLELCSKIPEMLNLIPIVVKDYKSSYYSAISDQVLADSSNHPIVIDDSMRPLGKALLEELNRTGVEMYCVKCRAKRFDPNAVRVTMKNGKAAIKGKCPICGTGMYKIGMN